MPQLHDFRYPDESDAYRAARNALLEAERVSPQNGRTCRITSRLAAQRLDPGEYPFVDRAGGRVAMLELYGTTHDTLVLYSFIHRT